MRKLLSSSHCDATDQASAVARQPHSRRRIGAPRRALAVLVGCVALFALPAAANAATGSIKGHVTEGEGAAITGAEACAFESAIEKSVACATTDGSGEYTIAGLAAAEYKVRFTKTGFATQWYNHMPTWSSATSVEVTSGGTAFINATMVEEGEGSIAGRVTDASNGQGVSGFEVCASTFSVEFGYKEFCVKTGPNGEYTRAGLPAGIYQVSFSAPGETCEEEQGEKVRCEPSSNYIGQQVSSVRVKATKPTTVNAALQSGGQVSGTVTNASITHPGIAKLTICATKVQGSEEEEFGGACAYTNSKGEYTINGLQGGSYKVKFNGYICTIPKKGQRECPEVYVGTYYHGQQTFKKGESVSVTTGSNTGGINESLREAFPTTPASTAAPTLTGTPAVGQALSCSQGSWSHEPTYLVYQWLRNGTVISGQTGPAYALQAADQGQAITCSVTAGNGAGAATAISNAVTIPVPLAVFVNVKVKGAVASVTLRCPGPGSCSGVMKIVARVVTKHGKRKVTIGVASFSMLAGKRVTLRVHLTGPGSKLLRRAGRRGLKVQITGSGVQAHTAVLKAAKHK
jgi:Carboxypeptidase regulatory-like domain